MTTAPAATDASAADDWRRLAERAVGASIETLRSRSAEGLAIEPVYAPARAPDIQPWRRDAAWTVAQRLDHRDPEAANAFALADLEGGANALVLVDAASPFARGFGLELAQDDLDAALTKIELDFIKVRLDAGAATPAALHALTKLVDTRRLTSAALDVDSGYDPIGLQARLGGTVDGHRLEESLDLRAKAGLCGHALLADGRPWHEAGAGEAQELAAVLATAVAYMRRLEALGLRLEEARQSIAILLAADADVVLGVIKFRALRRLWARIESACGLEPAPLRIHAETSWRMMTRYDPWTNVMRTTAAAFAAGIGGADAICVLPFTLPLGLPDDAARRLARNSQTILNEEAQLARVADPAAGAGGFEALTDALCRDTWDRFQAIEGEGGLPRAIPHLRATIADTVRRRGTEIATLARGIIGTSRFASLDAWQPDVLAVEPRPGPKRHPDALPSQRDAAPFERLRDRADRHAATHPRPEVFLVTFGTPATFAPAATDAINFFAAAGIAATAPLDERDVGELIDAFRASGARVACLCGLQDGDAPSVGSAIEALRAAGARRLLLVGDSQSGAGVDGCIHAGCNAISILCDILDVVLEDASQE